MKIFKLNEAKEPERFSVASLINSEGYLKKMGDVARGIDTEELVDKFNIGESLVETFNISQTDTTPYDSLMVGTCFRSIPNTLGNAGAYLSNAQHEQVVQQIVSIDNNNLVTFRSYERDYAYWYQIDKQDLFDLITKDKYFSVLDKDEVDNLTNMKRSALKNLSGGVSHGKI